MSRIRERAAAVFVEPDVSASTVFSSRAAIAPNSPRILDTLPMAPSRIVMASPAPAELEISTSATVSSSAAAAVVPTNPVVELTPELASTVNACVELKRTSPTTNVESVEPLVNVTTAS